jgi:hypothetical protein
MFLEIGKKEYNQFPRLSVHLMLDHRNPPMQMDQFSKQINKKNLLKKTTTTKKKQLVSQKLIRDYVNYIIVE